MNTKPSFEKNLSALETALSRSSLAAFILLSSFTSIREHYIPLTFLLVAIFYLGGQIYEGIFVPSNISNFTHILGGVVGAWFGFFLMSK